MVIDTITDGLSRSVGAVTDGVTGLFTDPTIRLGVTGLSRAGKTVFITSLIANLLDRGRMPQLLAASSGSITHAYLQPQPDDTLPRFDYEAHLGAMTGTEPHWPQSTRAVSELRLSLRVKPQGFIGSFSGPRTVHLDIVDYPGEWLLDLGLLDKTYAEWSAEVLSKGAARAEHGPYHAALADVQDGAAYTEPTAQRLAAAFTTALRAARKAGYADCTPGRFLLPGELEGSPVLTFAPLAGTHGARKSLFREMERRFEAYKSKVVKPFFREHFARLDRQVVLVDVLGAIYDGPRAVEATRQTMADILGAFRPGRNAFLTSLFAGRRVDRILFAATKADHLHHAQHKRLTAIMEALTREARDRARFAGAETGAMAIASLRTTTETEVEHDGDTLKAVAGITEAGTRAAFYPGELPEDPTRILAPAREGADDWPFGDVEVMRFKPAEQSIAPGDGPPHIRLDKAAEFLMGDRLR
ncbi:MAG: YcjX family protein [Pseudomonadota bacterium]